MKFKSQHLHKRDIPKFSSTIIFLHCIHKTTLTELGRKLPLKNRNAYTAYQIPGPHQIIHRFIRNIDINYSLKSVVQRQSWKRGKIILTDFRYKYRDKCIRSKSNLSIQKINELYRV